MLALLRALLRTGGGLVYSSIARTWRRTTSLPLSRMPPGVWRSSRARYRSWQTQPLDRAARAEPAGRGARAVARHGRPIRRAKRRPLRFPTDRKAKISSLPGPHPSGSRKLRRFRFLTHPDAEDIVSSASRPFGSRNHRRFRFPIGSLDENLVASASPSTLRRRARLFAFPSLGRATRAPGAGPARPERLPIVRRPTIASPGPPGRREALPRSRLAPNDLSGASERRDLVDALRPRRGP